MMTSRRWSLRVAALACMIVCVAGAGGGVVVAQPGPHTGCLVVQGGRAHDFGKMEQTQTVEHTFVLKNTCSETIELDGAKTSCGCTAAVVSEKSVPPGGTARINVRYTPTTGSAGLVTKTVSVYERGQPAAPIIDMTISATVKTDLTITPSNARFGEGTPGSAMTATVTLRNTGDRPFVVEPIINTMTVYAGDVGGSTGAATPIPHSAVRIEPTDLYLKAGEKREVRVTVTPSASGQLYGAIEFKSPTARVFLSLSGVVGVGTGDAGSGSAAPQPSTPAKKSRKSGGRK